MGIVEINYRSLNCKAGPPDQEHIEFTAFRYSTKILMKSVDKNFGVHDFTIFPVNEDDIKNLFKYFDLAVQSGDWAENSVDKSSELPVTEMELTFDNGERKSYLCTGFTIPYKEKIVPIIRNLFRIKEDEELFFNY